MSVSPRGSWSLAVRAVAAHRQILDSCGARAPGTPAPTHIAVAARMEDDLVAAEGDKATVLKRPRPCYFAAAASTVRRQR
jgi:hypothetical protein